MRANYMMGCVCRDMGDAPMALQYYEDAVYARLHAEANEG